MVSNASARRALDTKGLPRMKCPHCGHDGQPVVSGPHEHPLVPGLAHVVCSGCDKYLSSVTAPMPEGTVKPFPAVRERSPAELDEAA